MERAIRVIGWAGVIVGLSGVLPGVFLLRGSMIEFGMLVLLLSALVLLGLGALGELRHIRRGIARLAVRAEQVASPSGEHSVASPSGEHSVASPSGEHSEEQRAE